ncbi:MAG: hypothetical protein ABEJ64_03440 [Candidatus Nanohaloarchaea archaeon]
MVEISGCLILQDDKLLMTYRPDIEAWGVPQGPRKQGELTSDAAERIAEDVTGCTTETARYRRRFKTEFEMEGEKFLWQPYSMHIDGEPEDAEWVPLDKVDSRELAPPLSSVAGKIQEKL